MIGAALAVFAAAALLGWFGPARVPAGSTLAWLLNAAGSAVLVVAGGRGLVGHPGALHLGTLGGLGAATLRIDPLSALFLVIAFGVAVPVSLAGAATRPPSAPAHGHAAQTRLAAAVAMTLGAVAVIVTADHLFVLLFGWETLTFAFYLLSGFDRARAGRARASVATVTFSKSSGAALLLGGLILAAHAHTFALADLGGGTTGAARSAAYALLLLGFGVKVGLVPVHVWLPPGYAAAPGPARAIMAGVAVNVGFYGMWRTLEVLGAPPVWLVVVVLLLAGITAILGIAHSAVHADLSYLVAWSSVENAGLITAGFATALVGAAARNPQLVAAGLLAGTAQICAHALGKSLLFVTTSGAERALGTTNLDGLRGVVRRLPWTGAGLVVGALTLAGLPLTAGFASEWFTLESLMQEFRVHSLPMQLATAAAGSLVALTVGVAGVTFVRLIALTAFGQPPAALADNRGAHVDRSIYYRTGVALLVTGCLGVAAVAPFEVRLIAAGLSPITGSTVRGALASPWVLQPVFANFSALSPSWLWVTIPVLVLLICAVTLALSGRRFLRVRRVPAWNSASPGVDRTVGYTSYGFANPMRHVLANVLLTRSELREDETLDEAETPSLDGNLDGGAGTSAASARLGYSVHVVDVVDQFLYEPLGRALWRVVGIVKRLQSGRIEAYLTYMLLALVAVLAVVTATA